MKGTYRYQSLSKVSLDGVQVAAGGRSQSAGAVMNILWDIPMPLEIPIQPFVGMGVGVVHTNLNFAGGGNTYMHQGRWDPAYSMMAGFALPLDADHPHPPQLRFGLGLRQVVLRDALKCREQILLAALAIAPTPFGRPRGLH